MRNANINLGDRFCKLTVLEKVGSRDKKQYWKCLCDCGNTKEISSGDLNYGKSKSCGCLKVSTIIQQSTSHGQASGGKVTSEYNAWRNMITRCTNPNATRFHHHGGRGIKVCERWLKSFELFFKDMGNKPSPNHSLDRYPDNDGNYEPSNCRWATAKEQCANRSNSVFYEYEGKNMVISQWASYFNVNDRTFRDYVKRNGIKNAALHYGNKLRLT